MVRMRYQSGTDVRTESIAFFKLWVESNEEEPPAAITADSLIVATCVFRAFVMRR